MIKYVATCLFGLEHVLGEEIDALGLKRTFTMDGRVFFEGPAADCARANVNLRTAERVFILVGDPFEARSFDELFEGCRALEWEEYVGRDDAFPVSGHSVKSALTSIPDCQKIVKKSMATRLGAKYGLGILPETGAVYKTEFFIFKDTAYLMIDTSGVALHKRGYRPAANAAPLRETLAAYLATNARVNDSICLWDPFCGSGTIAIESAMIALNKAPGLQRSFAAENFASFGSELWANAREEAQCRIKSDANFLFRATDVDPACIKTAEENAHRAGVAKFIEFGVADARRIEKPREDMRGTLICNPPYGERMMSMSEAEALYRAIGKNFARFEPWHIYVLTSCEYFERLYGRRADRKRKLYNGMIPTTLYQFFKPAAPRKEHVAPAAKK